MFVYSFNAGHYIQLSSVFLFHSLLLGAESIATLWKISMN